MQNDSYYPALLLNISECFIDPFEAQCQMLIVVKSVAYRASLGVLATGVIEAGVSSYQHRSRACQGIIQIQHFMACRQFMLLETPVHADGPG